MAKKILLIEKLGVTSLIYFIFFSRRFEEAFYISEGKFFSVRCTQWLISKIKNIRQLSYMDFPGSYYEVQKESVLNANDLFYKSSRGSAKYIDFLLKFKDSDLVETGVKKGLFEYTSGRVKTYVFIKKLLEKSEGPIEFIPVDNIDFSRYISKVLIQPTNRYCVPRSIHIINRIEKLFSGPYVGLYSTAVVAYLLLARGITWHYPEPKKYQVGFFIFNHGIHWERPYHDTFIYGKNVDSLFRPEKILHVVTDSLKDQKTKLFYEEKEYPYVEFGKLKIPVSYFVKRVIFEFYFNAILAIFHSGSSFCTKAARSAILMTYYIILNEILYLYYDIKLFIARDEYVVNHIARTIVAREKGGKTLGFMHGDDNHLYFGNNYLCFDYYCLFGSFYHELQLSSLRFTKHIEIIGAGIYGIDQSFKQITEGHVPEKYMKIKDNYKIVTVFASSFDPDLFLTKELTVYFYEKVFSLLKKYEDIFLVVKPKYRDLLKAEIMQLLKETGSERVVIENEIDTYELIPISDLMIVIDCGTVGIEGLMANRKVLYFDVSNYQEHPYRKYDPHLVALTDEEFYRNVDLILRKEKYISYQTLEHLRVIHGYKFDGHVVDRLREVASKALEC